MNAVINDNNQYVIGKQTYERVTHVIEATVGRVEIERWRRSVGEQVAGRITFETSVWGTNIHDLLMYSDKSKWKIVEKMLNINGELMPSLLAWREWVEITIKKWVAVEEVVYSRRLGIAGRVDRVGYIYGDEYPSIIDIKTGELRENAGIQIWGAYRELWNERRKEKQKVGRGLAVQVPRKEPGVLRVKDYTKDKYIALWEDAKRDYFNSIGKVY